MSVQSEKMSLPKPCQRVVIFLLFALLINIIVFVITPQSPSHIKRKYLQQYRYQYGDTTEKTVPTIDEEELDHSGDGTDSIEEESSEKQTESDLSS